LYMATPAVLTEAQVDRFLVRNFDEATALQERQIPDGSMFKVQPGSSLAGDDRASDPYQVSHGVTVAIGTAVEHVHAVKALIMDARVMHPAAPFTLLRAAIEAGSTAAWLIGPTSRRERVIRRLQQVLRDAQDGDRAARELGLAPTKPLAVREAELADMARRVMGDPSFRLKPAEMTPIVKFAQDASGSTLKVLTSWRVCAGFSHGRLWATLSMLDREVVEKLDSRVVYLRVRNSKERVLWALSVAMDLVRFAASQYERRRVRHY
jgi:hypothetical protein